MVEKIRTIRLYGPLGTRFGRVHRLAVSSTAEAVRALCRMVPGFEKYLMNARDHGMKFAVFNGKRNLSIDQLVYPVGQDDIRIAPVLMGSKSGIFTALLGAALIGAAFIPGLNVALWSGASSTFFGLGASLALGGVMQMISPQTTTSTGSTADTKSSYYFSGAVNSTAQGDPVPLAYGRIRVGSKRISSGIYAEDQS